VCYEALTPHNNNSKRVDCEYHTFIVNLSPIFAYKINIRCKTLRSTIQTLSRAMSTVFPNLCNHISSIPHSRSSILKHGRKYISMGFQLLLYFCIAATTAKPASTITHNLRHSNTYTQQFNIMPTIIFRHRKTPLPPTKFQPDTPSPVVGQTHLDSCKRQLTPRQPSPPPPSPSRQHIEPRQPRTPSPVVSSPNPESYIRQLTLS
jgi:hypothetical protein